MLLFTLLLSLQVWAAAKMDVTCSAIGEDADANMFPISLEMNLSNKIKTISIFKTDGRNTERYDHFEGKNLYVYRNLANNSMKIVATNTAGILNLDFDVNLGEAKGLGSIQSPLQSFTGLAITNVVCQSSTKYLD